jgi:NAD(P)H-hydrate repair Nnr-like enzyme with NAD(P)H-hydrate epimerase domain
MPVPVISVEEMRAWEQATWDQGITELEVIDQVGQAIADWIKPNLNQNGRVLILAGKGHNGDDGKAAASHLPDSKSIVIEITDPATALSKVEETLNQSPILIVDCLFIGVGIARRPPLPPNRTCGFPAYGSPVTGLPARSSRTSAGQETALLACSTRQRLGEGSTDLLQCHSS